MIVIIIFTLIMLSIFFIFFYFVIGLSADEAKEKYIAEIKRQVETYGSK